MKRTKEGKDHGEPHVVPLPTQAVALLRDLVPVPGGGHLVFPGQRSHDRPISDKSLRTALLSMGYGPQFQTWHGFRATARTMLAERLDLDLLVIKAQLAHSVRDANGRAYNRTQYLVHRWTMMQAWADYLDRLRLRDHGGIEHKVVLRDLAMARELASRFRAGPVRVHVHGTWFEGVGEHPRAQ